MSVRIGGTWLVKVALKKMAQRKRSRILYLNHVEFFTSTMSKGDGRLLFEEIVKTDLEGIVC